jgi:hypothetical protein
VHFNGQAHSPRMQDDVDAGIDLVFSALNHMRVLSHTYVRLKRGKVKD